MLEFVPDPYSRERFLEAAMFLDRQTLTEKIGAEDFERAFEHLAPTGLSRDVVNKLKPSSATAREQGALDGRRARAHAARCTRSRASRSRSSLSTSFAESQVAPSSTASHIAKSCTSLERTVEAYPARSCGDLAPARALHRAPPRSGGAPGRDDQTRRVRPQRSHGISHAARGRAEARSSRSARCTSTARRACSPSADAIAPKRCSSLVVVLISGRGSNMQALIEARAGERGHQQSRRRRGTRHRRRARHRDARGGPSRPWHAGRLRGGARRREERFAPRLVALAGHARADARVVARHRERLLNIHPSLLAFPGLHTHERALAAGVKVHGCTVHFVTAELRPWADRRAGGGAGAPGTTTAALAARVLTQEHVIYPRAVRWFLEGRLADGIVRVRGEDAQLVLAAE